MIHITKQVSNWIPYQRPWKPEDSRRTFLQCLKKKKSQEFYMQQKYPSGWKAKDVSR